MTRLAVIDRGALRVHDMTRGTSLTLSTADAANRQPTWTPDGRFLAWSRYDRRDADARSRVVVHEVDTAHRRELDLVFPAFYLHFRPDGGALATLGEGPLGLELTVLDLASGEASIVTRGAPLYFDWLTSGLLIAHVGLGSQRHLERLCERVPDSGSGPLPAPASFTAPAAWPGTDRVLAAVRRDGTSMLVLLDAGGEILARVATFAGAARFTASPDGRHVAYVGAPADEADGPAPFTPDVRRAVVGELVVHDVVTDAANPIGQHAPLTFEWSPDGRHLLFLSAVEVGTARWYRWHVYSGGEVRPLDWCRPSVVEAREYLPFAEQFTRSHRRWSPDGRRFCYAGTAPDGREGVWVQSLDDATPELLGTGQAAVWSP